MKSTVLLMCAVLVAFCFIGCAREATKPQTLPELQAAEKALLQAEAEGAATLCATEYQAAKDKLRQAELLFQDGQMDPARNAANQAIDLANIARQCAVAHKSPVSAPPIPTAKPPLAPSQDFQNLKHSVYFDFNSNVLTAAERERLDPVIAQISRMAKNFKFFVVLTAYCDAPGTAETNQALAIRRAEVVRFYLTRPETGIIPDRVVIVAMGNGPATSEAGAPGKNREWRRVDLRISMTPPEEATQQQPAPESPPQPPPLPVPHH